MFGRQKTKKSVGKPTKDSPDSSEAFQLDLYKFAFVQYYASLKLGHVNVTVKEKYQALLERADFEIPKQLIKEYEEECKQQGRKPYRL